MPDLRSGLKIGLKILVSITFIALIFHQVRGVEVLENLSSLSLSWCIAASVAATFHILFAGINIWLFLRATSDKPPFLKFLRLYIYSYSSSLILPGQTGDAVIAVFLKQQGIAYKYSLTSYVLDKFVTLSFMLCVCAGGFVILFPQAAQEVLLVSLASSLFLFFLSYYLLNSESWIALITAKYNVRDLIEEFRNVVLVILSKRAHLLANIALTVINWTIVSCSYYFVFRGLGSTNLWPAVAFIPIMSSLVGYLPISISGLGPVEYSATFLFGLIGLSEPLVVTAYIVQRTLQYVVALILLSLTCMGSLVSRSYDSEKALVSN